MSKKLTVSEAAERLGIDISTVYRYLRAGRILDPITRESLPVDKHKTRILLTDDGKAVITGSWKPSWAEGHVAKPKKALTNPVPLVTSRPVVSVAQAAKILGKSTRMVRLLAAQGRIIEPDSGQPIPPVKKGGRYMIPLGDDNKPLVAPSRKRT